MKGLLFGRAAQRPINPGNVSADQLGDLASLAASMPGVQLIPGADGSANGFSVLGMGPDANQTTLNGLNFGGSQLPKLARSIGEAQREFKHGLDKEDDEKKKSS